MCTLASFITAERSLELRVLRQPGEPIHWVRIPAIPAAAEPWRWAPLELRVPGDLAAIECIIAAHPSGILCRAEIRQTEGITHLYVTECRSDLPRLAASPIQVRANEHERDQLLCVGTDGNCLLLDGASLRTISSWQAAKRVSGGAVAKSGRVFLGLEGSTVQALRLDAERLVPDWQQELQGPDWQLAGLTDGFLLATNPSGLVLALDPSTGQTVWSHTAPAPLALPPTVLAAEIVLATMDGGLFFVPGPKVR